ncbi:hypothetical protein [Spiroplasma culicicola]|uniref:Uncharacterized protein n=1 Tax=Spiroplasma culicicola AES-1 TaxID=1276246 RepID=W6A7Q4_9MOLU|nr:hypothetical protein [Spiroplasma culicicola]AHI53168.1 hypothetical protein SCULI_v1c08280 [Spiroplasma culicicola AES-1]
MKENILFKISSLVFAKVNDLDFYIWGSIGLLIFLWLLFMIINYWKSKKEQKDMKKMWLKNGAYSLIFIVIIITIVLIVF